MKGARGKAIERAGVETMKTLYHVTRTGREESILREGLRPDVMDTGWEKPRGRKAVFFWGSLESARKAVNPEAFNGTLDGMIFRVCIPRSWVYPDTTWVAEDLDEPKDRFVCFRRIPPDRLENLRTGDSGLSKT